MLHHRRGIAGGFRVDPINPTVKILNKYGNLNGTGSGLQTRRIGRSYEKNENSSEIEFSSRAHQEDESGYSSPPLWKTSPSMSPPMTRTTKASTIQHHLPLTSRSQAIAKGREEMMEMVEGIPESAYELSLKDLVELPLNKAVWQSALVDDRDSRYERTHEHKTRKPMMTKKRKGKRHDSKRKVDNGPFLLKMFFPVSLGSKKKSSSGTGKVSPKPTSVSMEREEDKVVFNKRVDEEWWDKSSTAAEEKENRGRRRISRSSRSSSTGESRDKDGFLPGCWSFFSGNGKAGERKGYNF